ncbi:MAG: T9SS type A sorting domain-containing protein, partial [Candidatus Delongbacteria bacterium]|nr:T9SS type A sorting domain-containing protein [Candidatus Delongbacteria bacterium]
MEFSEDPEVNGAIDFTSNITMDPIDPITTDIIGFTVSIQELDDHNWFGDIKLTIETFSFSSKTWSIYAEPEEPYTCDPWGGYDITFYETIDTEGYYRATFSSGTSSSQPIEFFVLKDLSGDITLSYTSTEFDWNEVGNPETITLSSWYDNVEINWIVTLDPPEASTWLQFTSTSGNIPASSYSDIEFKCIDNNETDNPKYCNVTIELTNGLFRDGSNSKTITISQLPEPPEDCLVIDNTSFVIDYDNILPKSITITSTLGFDTDLTVSIDPSDPPEDIWIEDYPTTITVVDGDPTTIDFKCLVNDGISRNCNIVLTAVGPYFDGETVQTILVTQNQDPDLNGRIHWKWNWGDYHVESAYSNKNIHIDCTVEELDGLDYNGIILVDVELREYNPDSYRWDTIQNIVVDYPIQVNCLANSESIIHYYTPWLNPAYDDPEHEEYEYSVTFTIADTDNDDCRLGFYTIGEWETVPIILEENSYEFPYNYNDASTYHFGMSIDYSQGQPSYDVYYNIVEYPDWVEIISGESARIYTNDGPVIKVGEYSESNSQPGIIKIVLSDHGTFEGQTREAMFTVTQSNDPPLPEIELSGTTTFDVDYNESNIEFTVNKCDPDHPNQAPVNYSISNISNWIQVINGGTGVVPETTELKINKHFVDFSRSGTITLTSPSEFVQNPVTLNDPPYNTINVTQSPCPDSATDHLKPQLAVFDNTRKLIHYDPMDLEQHTIKTNVITNLDPFFSDDFIATTACDYDNDGIDEQVVLHKDFDGYSLLFYKLGEPEYSKKIILGDYSTDFNDIESTDVNNDGIGEIVVVSNTSVLIFDVQSETQINSYDITSESLNNKVSIAVGDFNNDNINDIVLCDGNKVITLSVEGSNITKIIPNYELISEFDYTSGYTFQDLTNFTLDSKNILLLVFQGMYPLPPYGYSTQIIEFEFDPSIQEYHNSETYSGLARIPINSKYIRKITTGNFSEDASNEIEFAFLHSKNNITTSEIVNTTSISILKLQQDTDLFEFQYEIDASEYIENYLDLTAGQFYDPLKLVLQPGSELVIKPGDNLIIYPNMKVEARLGAKITVRDGAVLDLTNVTIVGTDTWQGITTEVGSTIILSNTIISNAETAINASATNVNITNSTFTECENGVELINCNLDYNNGLENFILKDNNFNGNGIGIGISLIQSSGETDDNTIENFAIGLAITSCSPKLIDNTIQDNTYYGIFITGWNTVPQLVDSSSRLLDLNNVICNNGTNFYDSAQIYVKYAAGVYMDNGYNNIYSDLVNGLPTVPCIKGDTHLTSKATMPSVVGLNAINNYWGTSEVNEDNYAYLFSLYERYRLSYDPYSSVPYRNNYIEPIIYGTLDNSGKILIKAMEFEDDGKYDQAIKKLEMLIDKYPTSDETYVAHAILPDLYAKQETALEPLLKVYDEQLESEDETINKKFFKEMKVVVNIKSKKYDEAIVLAEEMKFEATSEGEVILAKIDIAICNMMKNAESKGKSTYDPSAISDLLAKLTRNEEEEGERTDIIESQLPTKFALYQNYPNPFNPTTKIKYALSQDSNVRIKIYNSNGSVVADLVNASQSVGYHSVTFDGAKLSNGIYYYSLVVNRRVVSTKRMLL